MPKRVLNGLHRRDEANTSANTNSSNQTFNTRILTSQASNTLNLKTQNWKEKLATLKRAHRRKREKRYEARVKHLLDKGVKNGFCFLVEGYVPHSILFTECAVVVHHGGKHLKIYFCI